MAEQTTPAADPATISPDPVAGNNPATEPQQAEPVSAPETPVVSEALLRGEAPQAEQPSEPITNTPTAQMAGSEPLGVGGPQGSLPFSKTDDRQENLVASAEVPKAETPTTEILTETAPPEQVPAPTQSIGSAQPEPTPAEPVVTASQPMLAQAPVTTSPRTLARLLLQKAQAVIQFRKQKKLTKIMELFAKKKHITNDEIEKLLHVSDATATRYLSELEKQGKITQTGKTGHAVTYTKR